MRKSQRGVGVLVHRLLGAEGNQRRSARRPRRRSARRRRRAAFTDSTTAQASPAATCPRADGGQLDEHEVAQRLPCAWSVIPMVIDPSVSRRSHSVTRGVAQVGGMFTSVSGGVEVSRARRRGEQEQDHRELVVRAAADAHRLRLAAADRKNRRARRRGAASLSAVTVSTSWARPCRARARSRADERAAMPRPACPRPARTCRTVSLVAHLLAHVDVDAAQADQRGAEEPRREHRVVARGLCGIGCENASPAQRVASRSAASSAALDVNERLQVPASPRRRVRAVRVRSDGAPACFSRRDRDGTDIAQSTLTRTTPLTNGGFTTRARRRLSRTSTSTTSPAATPAGTRASAIERAIVGLNVPLVTRPAVRRAHPPGARAARRRVEQHRDRRAPARCGRQRRLADKVARGLSRSTVHASPPRAAVRASMSWP